MVDTVQMPGNLRACHMYASPVVCVRRLEAKSKLTRALYLAYVLRL